MKNEYIIEYSKVENTNPIREINELFDKYVDEGYRKLLFFSTIMKDALLANKTVQLTIEGYCSPLALNDYNIHLANRRIASLKNYIKEFDNGFYVTYLNNGQLKIGTFTILNALGQIVFYKQNCNTMETIDVSGFASGVYFVRVNEHTLKMVKE
jgi:hypothetical protein